MLSIPILSVIVLISLALSPATLVKFFIGLTPLSNFPIYYKSILWLAVQQKKNSELVVKTTTKILLPDIKRIF